MMQFLDSYSAELAALETLFGKEKVAQYLPRLNYIHEHTEALWHNYASQIPGGRVNFLLIAEAPPWSEKDRPAFALDPDPPVPSGFLTAVRKAFDCRDQHPTVALPALAERGFLLLDSIPFAMPYASQFRAKVHYDELVRLSAASYMRRKIESSGLSFSPHLRIAFSLKMHARSILKALHRNLHAGGQAYPLSEDMIAVNGAGYPCSTRLRAAFGFPSP
jgi:hypothetical protein